MANAPLVLPLMMLQVTGDAVASASVAVTTPTTVPVCADSETLNACPAVICGALSFWSSTAMVKFCDEVEPSELVARIVMEWLAAVSRSKMVLVVTSPVVESIETLLPGFTLKLYVTLSVASVSLANPVMPTAVPTAEFSVTTFAAVLESETPLMANSLTSATMMTKLFVCDDPSALVAFTTILWLDAFS